VLVHKQGLFVGMNLPSCNCITPAPQMINFKGAAACWAQKSGRDGMHRKAQPDGG